MKRFALCLILALLVTAASAQSPYQITLTVPSIGGHICGVISNETITDANGNNVPYNITQMAGGLSDWVCNNYNSNPFFINLPPQPYVEQPEWVQILPQCEALPANPTACDTTYPHSKIVRGALPSASLYHAGSTVVSADSFDYLFTYEFYGNKYVDFVGTNTRTWLWHAGACRYGRCNPPYWSEQSAVVNMSATLSDTPPSAPVEQAELIIPVYRCGSDRRACLR